VATAVVGAASTLALAGVLAFAAVVTGLAATLTLAGVLALARVAFTFAFAFFLVMSCQRVIQVVGFG